MESETSLESRLRKAIRSVEHFPKPGVLFPDITTLLLQPAIFQEAVNAIAERYRDMTITHIVRYIYLL